MNVLKHMSENYEGDERTYIHKDGDEIVSSDRLLVPAHNSGGFDSCVGLNSLVKQITDLKIIKTARGVISLSIRCGVQIVNTVEVPQYVKFTCTKAHIKGSSKNSVENTVFNLNFLKGKLNTRVLVLIKVVFADLRHFWEPYLRLDVFCLAFIYARHSMELKK